MAGFRPAVLKESSTNSMDTAKRPASPLLSADPRAVLTFEAQKDGKLRATYAGWEDAKVFQPGEWVEVVTRNGQVQVFRRGEPLTGPAPDPYREWDGTADPEIGPVGLKGRTR